MALKGIKVLEMAGLAPAPFCGMILADFGATVIRIDKLSDNLDVDCLGNGKRSIQLNLKSPKGIDAFKKLCKTADVLIDPFRPGVMEKMGLGPKTLLEANKKLIYARMSGFGQKGVLSKKAGHDINYVSVTGLLDVAGGIAEAPSPPANFMADFAGGGLLCAFGIVSALHERNTSGYGQVIDADLTSGAAYVGSWLYRSQHKFFWGNPRGKNLLDGGSHFYRCYETSDGKFMAVGAIEPQFYAAFISALGLTEEEAPQFGDTTVVADIIGKRFKSKDRKHWIEVFSKADACVTPVFSISEAVAAFPERFVPGTSSPLAYPILSRTNASSCAGQPPVIPGQHTEEILREAGFSQSEIDDFVKNGAVPLSSKL